MNKNSKKMISFDYKTGKLLIEKNDDYSISIIYECFKSKITYKSIIMLEDFFVNDYDLLCDHLSKTHHPIYTKFINLISNKSDVSITFQTNNHKKYYTIDLYKQ